MKTTVGELTNVRYIVSATGEPEFVVLRWEDFARMVETLKIEADSQLMASLERARQRIKAGGKLLSAEEVFKDL